MLLHVYLRTTLVHGIYMHDYLDLPLPHGGAAQMPPEEMPLTEGGLTGLTSKQAEEHAASGQANLPVESPTKTTAQILRSNILTYFNAVFTLLAVCVILVGSWRDLMFMPVVIINTFIGIIQELRSKRTLDRLTLLSEPKCEVYRDGSVVTLNSSELVADDVVIFGAGTQICADAVIIDGNAQINEALVTGEADEISKGTGDELLSGSFVVAGSCTAKLTRVGADSFASRLTLEAKRSQKRSRPEMMKSLTKLIQVISFLIIPVGAALFYNQHYSLGLDLPHSVVATVAALVGMIPEGIYLLTSIALALGVVRLAKRRTLVHDLGCIETLARVNVLCVDKTGTITEPEMQVEELFPLCEDRFTADDIRMILADYAASLGGENETMMAIERHFTGHTTRKAVKTMPFTSAAKFSGAVFGEGETYILGAPEIVLGSDFQTYRDKIEPHLESGYRVLLLCMYDGALNAPLDGTASLPVALITLSNKIRENAPETFRFFAEQGVAIKVISGDNPQTVSCIAQKAGIENAELFIDASTIKSDLKLKAAAKKYTVFGRVTPEQKRKLISAIKAAGNTVAMTGDGVNDVLALKEADCGIAMASGSDVAGRVSQLVLLDSDFASMPDVVMEGRRVINNIQRSAALFLVKNMFSFALAVISMAAVLPYPVTSAQLSLVSMITIGLPSFFLALEPNNSLVKGRFLRNVLYRALPGGLTNVLLVLAVYVFAHAFNINSEQSSTMCAILLCAGGLAVLFRVCTPFTKLRKLLCAFIAAVLLFCIFFLHDLYAIYPLDTGNLMLLIVLVLLVYPVMTTISTMLNKFANFISALIQKCRED